MPISGPFILGCMAMFHGARGLAVLLGPSVVTILKILLSPIFGVPLIFAGVELANMVFDLKEGEDFFVVRVMFVTTLTVNRGAAFINQIRAVDKSWPDS